MTPAGPVRVESGLYQGDPSAKEPHPIKRGWARVVGTWGRPRVVDSGDAGVLRERCVVARILEPVPAGRRRRPCHCPWPGPVVHGSEAERAPEDRRPRFPWSPGVVGPGGAWRGGADLRVAPTQIGLGRLDHLVANVPTLARSATFFVPTRHRDNTAPVVAPSGIRGHRIRSLMSERR